MPSTIQLPNGAKGLPAKGSTARSNLSQRREIPNMPEEESSSLGLQWHVKQDAFSIKVVPKEREKTKAGALGHIGAVFDPLGIADPAKLVCRLLTREIIPRLGEDDPHGVRGLGYWKTIPAVFDQQWNKMVNTCKEIADSALKITRPLYPPDMARPSINNYKPLPTPQTLP